MATATVKISMKSGVVDCRGDVYRVFSGQPQPNLYEDVEVRPAMHSIELRLERPGNYQYRFDIQGGTGEYELVAKDDGNHEVGSDKYDGTVHVGLKLDIRLA